MITKSDLCTVIDPSYLEEGDSSFEFLERKNKQYGLRKVKFENSGHFVAFKDELFKASAKMYTVQFDEVHLQRDCDRVVLFEKNGQRYLCWIEIKTSIKQIFNSGIYQIPGCYYKIKSLLDDFLAHGQNDITECALAIYAHNAPPLPKRSSEPQAVVAYTTTKRQLIAPPETRHEKIERKYKATLLPGSVGMLEGADFGMDKLPIKNEYKIGSLPFVIWPVDYANGVVDMDNIVDLL